MPPSVRSISRKTGLSTATVSRALRGSPLVTAETRKRVEQAAKSIGYKMTPIVGAVLSNIRRATQHGYIGNLALIHVPSPSERELLPFQKDVIEGAKARAASLGFKLELFDLGKLEMRPEALSRVLQARGIAGVILIHKQRRQELDGFAWEQFPLVEIDHSLGKPSLHTVCIEHFETLTLSLERLTALGYRRPGLFLEEHKDKRLKYVWSAAFRSFQETHLETEGVPPLRVTRMSAEDFLAWFRAHTPDLVIGHRDEAIEWLHSSGHRIPSDIGFFNLNWNERSRPCAGLDLRPELQGEVAVDAVVAQIHRNEKGIPTDPRTTMVSGRWVNGPTLRKAIPAGARPKRA